jgi:PIN domain nuclease of toxin-antitoxin system
VPPRFLLDTHILLWWTTDAKLLSTEQSRVIETAVRRGEKLAVCTITLLEIALLVREGLLKLKRNIRLADLFALWRVNPVLSFVPINYEIAADVAAIGHGWDPIDRTIVATARVYGLRLLTVDGRIVQSGLVPVIE